jgi:NADH:ubiquinone oxidoreductase subunit 5 (subunit L)/multisubunit Na+/H+ antiporter MnhA subunit
MELCEWSSLHLEVYISIVRGLFVTLVLLVSLFITIYIGYYINLEFSSRAYSLLILAFMGRIMVLLVSANWLILMFG